MKIAGIDPSLTSTGMCVLDNNKFIAGKLIKPGKLRGMKRLSMIKENVLDMCKKHKVTTIGIEGYGFLTKGRGFELGEVGGIIRLSLFEEGIPYASFAPTQIKKFTTGSGNAKKDHMLKAVYKRWKFDTDDDNLADAFAIAKLQYAICDVLNKKSRIKNYLKYEQEVINKIIENEMPHM